MATAANRIHVDPYSKKWKHSLVTPRPTAHMHRVEKQDAALGKDLSRDVAAPGAE